MIVWLIVLVPLAAAAVVAAAPRHTGLVAGTGLGTTAGLATWAAATRATAAVSWGPRLELTLSVTDFARVMAVLVPVIAFPIVMFAAVTETAGRTKLIAFLTAFAGAMELLVVADDLLTLLIAWELVGALSWILIAHETNDASNAQQASHAFLTTRAGDLGLYVAAGTAFASTGSFAFADISSAAPGALAVIAAGVVVAAAAKSGQVPFSPWLFSAMAGPTPVSALLHSSTMVAAGAYVLVRLAPQLDSVVWFGPVVVVIGVTSALAGGVVAAVQRHPKRLLAGSTTSQYGLMFAAVGAGSVVASSAQLVTHAAFKSLLFLSAGVAMHAARSDDLGDMRLGRRLPVTAALAGVGTLALGALPPFGGAWSKEQITTAAFESSALVGSAVIVAGSIGTFYALRYWLLAYGPGAEGPRGPATGAPWTMWFLAATSIALGLLWLPPVHRAGADLVAGQVPATEPWELVLGFAAVGVAAAAALRLARRGRLVDGFLPSPLLRAASSWFGIPGAAKRLVVAPTLAASGALASIDDRVVDAGIRASARTATALSALLRRRWEISIDAIVDGIAGATFMTAAGSRIADEHAVDRTVEGIGRGFGRAGHVLRKLQSGLSHHYYVMVVAGTTVLLIALAVGKS